MQYHATPCKSMQYHAISCKTMRYHAIPCNIIKYHAIPCNTMQYNAIPCNTMQYHVIPCNTMQYYAIQCNTLHYHLIPCIFNNCWWSVPLPCGQYMAIFILELPSLTSFLVHFQLLPKSAAPETITFFLPGCLPGIEDRVVLSDLYNLFSQSWSKLTSVNNQVNINYK